MDLKAKNVFFDSVKILLSLASNCNCNCKYSSSNCHFKGRHVGKHHRAQLKPNLEPFDCFRRAYWIN